VAIILKKKIAIHVYQKEKIKGYALLLKLSFKGKYTVNIINIYNPPMKAESSEMRNKIRKWLINQIRSAKAKNQTIIVGGDWNTVLDRQKDRESYTTNNTRHEYNQTLKTMKQMRLMDTYKLLNKRRKGEKMNSRIE